MEKTGEPRGTPGLREFSGVGAASAPLLMSPSTSRWWAVALFRCSGLPARSLHCSWMHLQSPCGGKDPQGITPWASHLELLLQGKPVQGFLKCPPLPPACQNHPTHTVCTEPMKICLAFIIKEKQTTIMRCHYTPLEWHIHNIPSTSE